MIHFDVSSVIATLNLKFLICHSFFDIVSFAVSLPVEVFNASLHAGL